MLHPIVRISLLLASTVVASAASNFSADQMKLLMDPAGWDYLKMTSTGMRTDHPCFNGKPPSDECSGRLILGADHQFIQEVTIHGQTVPRHGTYALTGNQLTFVDELKTADGPYTVEFDPRTTILVLSMQQVRIELTMHKPMPAPGKPASSILNAEQLKLLKDPAGWDYFKMSDTGIETDHPCFDGKPHSADECSGRLIFGGDDKFTQSVTIHGQTAPRHGTYTLENDQLTLIDELGTGDGPYTIEVDLVTKALAMSTSSVRMELTLHKAVQNRKRKESK